jgi:hypothetical protein
MRQRVSKFMQPENNATVSSCLAPTTIVLFPANGSPTLTAGSLTFCISWTSQSMVQFTGFIPAQVATVATLVTLSSLFHSALDLVSENNSKWTPRSRLQVPDVLLSRSRALPVSSTSDDNGRGTQCSPTSLTILHPYLRHDLNKPSQPWKM